MSMQVFPVQFFNFSTVYPESGTRIQLGNSYQFDAAPTAPDQRMFILRLSGMAYFPTPLESPERNMEVLETFYNHHKRAKPFLFNHPIYGQVECKFFAPLQIPEIVPGGMGVLGDFEVQLIEVP